MFEVQMIHETGSEWLRLLIHVSPWVRILVGGRAGSPQKADPDYLVRGGVGGEVESRSLLPSRA